VLHVGGVVVDLPADAFSGVLERPEVVFAVVLVEGLEVADLVEDGRFGIRRQAVNPRRSGV